MVNEGCRVLDTPQFCPNAEFVCSEHLLQSFMGQTQWSYSTVQGSDATGQYALHCVSVKVYDDQKVQIGRLQPSE